MNKQTIETFFKRYAEVSMSDEPRGLAKMYEQSFIVGGPKGATTYPNDDKFLDWLQRVHDFNAHTGMHSMSVSKVMSTQELSATHTIATVEWDARFDKTGDTPITFEITYLLQDLGEGPKILAFISHADQEDEMKRLGLL